jgi:hypothetical protein
MATANVIVLVRDAKTGHIVVTPPKEQLWLVREKIGYGRASKNDYHVLSEVGTKFFEEMDHFRRWHFGFADYYDVYVWDAEAGTDFAHLYNQLQQVSSVLCYRCDPRQNVPGAPYHRTKISEYTN